MNTRCAAVSGWRRRGEQHVATCGRANRAFDRRSGCFRVRSSLFALASNHRALLRALSQTALDGPSPPCQLPLHCRRQTALPVAVAGSMGPFVCCCWMGDRRRHPRGWPELPVRAGCYRSRSGMSQTALVRRRCASCRCRAAAAVGLPRLSPWRGPWVPLCAAAGWAIGDGTLVGGRSCRCVLLLSIALRYVADRAGPSPLCQLPLRPASLPSFLSPPLRSSVPGSLRPSSSHHGQPGGSPTAPAVRARARWPDV